MREEVQREPHDEGGDSRIGQSNVKGNTIMDKSSCLNISSERRRSLGKSPSDLFQSRSGSTSPARLETLIQSQARELSQLRQEIKETRRLGVLQRQQLEDLGKAFSNLIQSAKLDNLMGEEVKKQLDRSLAIMDSLEGRLDRSWHCLDGESYVGIDSFAPKVTHRLTRDLQEKNRLIQTLQSQTGGHNQSSQDSSHSDLYPLDRAFSSPHSSLSTHGSTPGQSQQHSADWTGPGGGGVLEEGAPVHRDTAGRLQGLQRENVRLQEQLRNSTDLNTTLRSELDLRCTIMAQVDSHGEARPQNEAKVTADTGSSKGCPLTSDLLAEHLQEIRALRQRLEESIRNNDSLREQLEKKLAEVEKDPVRAHIFIQDHEEHSQVSKEVQFLLQQNQTLKSESQDKQKENDKLCETLARRTAKLEHSRRECEALRKENIQVQERLELMTRENAQLQDSLHLSKDELHRLQCEVKLQGQEFADSQNLLQSLRVELQVYEKLKNQRPKSTEDGDTPQRQDRAPLSDPVDLGELLSEIKHLRLQLERSIQTNTALRQKLEEQLSRGPNHSETININYLLTSDEAAMSPGRESMNLLQHVERATVLQDQKNQPVVDGESLSVSSVDSFSGAPSRLVPGHKMWANRNGRHILGLIEDYNALRKQISEGRKLSYSVDTQLQECMLVIKQQCSDKLMEQQPLKSLCHNMNTLQQVLEEASCLLKLLWRVSLPVDIPTRSTGNNQQDEQLKREISRLKNRVLQQEKMLSGAVKRLRTTNQLKEGMERVIIDQLSLTHGVLKKARGNLEEIPVEGL